MTMIDWFLSDYFSRFQNPREKHAFIIPHLTSMGAFLMLTFHSATILIRFFALMACILSKRILLPYVPFSNNPHSR
jgi:hypothetical protein